MLNDKQIIGQWSEETKWVGLIMAKNMQFISLNEYKSLFSSELRSISPSPSVFQHLLGHHQRQR